MPPEAFKEMQIDTKGEFSGLGIQISIKDKMLTVIAPIEIRRHTKQALKPATQLLK